MKKKVKMMGLKIKKMSEMSIGNADKVFRIIPECLLLNFC